jgi:hypothetical protein
MYRFFCATELHSLESRAIRKGVEPSSSPLECFQFTILFTNKAQTKLIWKNVMTAVSDYGSDMNVYYFCKPQITPLRFMFRDVDCFIRIFKQ